jgi:alkanesulfonate monooxygenase SsuD/methylene tetrahydromethanopterin reductase-like flavin-dependent oxidoreductase (luciferase family)
LTPVLATTMIDPARGAPGSQLLTADSRVSGACAMKFGLLYELQFARPWSEGWESRIYHQALEQIALADRVGFHAAWAVEHHFLTEYSHSSAPEVFLSAASQRTERIRLGHGVVLLPTAYNNPIRVAERVAALDILSNGRVEFGTGRSGTPAEILGFSLDPAATRAMWDEALHIIPRMWTEDPFCYEGEFFSMPARSIWPKPVQKPHPPIWVAATSPQTYVDAGERGLGVLCFIIGQPDELQKRIVAYRGALTRAEPAGKFVNSQAAGFTVTLCLDDDEEARRIGGPAGLWYTAMLSTILGEWRGQVVPGYEYYGNVNREAAQSAAREAGSLIDSGVFCIGDPETCIRIIERYEAAGVDQLLCLMQAGRIPHEKIMRSIELFGEKIIPRFG